MQSLENNFNEIVRKVRKEHFGKGPERIKTVFVDHMAISTLYGNMTPVEKFIAQTPGGADAIHQARTKMIQKFYKENPPHDMENLIGAKLVHLFSDFKVEEDLAVSVFVFDRKVKTDCSL